MANRNITRLDKIEAARAARRGGVASFVVEMRDGETEGEAMARHMAERGALPPFPILAPAEAESVEAWARKYGANGGAL